MVTNGASDTAQNLVDSVNKGDITGWDVAAAVLVIVASIPLARVAAAAVRRALRRAGIASPDVAGDLGRLAKWLVYLSGFALALSILGVNVGFLSVVFAFALVIGALMVKPMVENSASGILLVARPMFSVGDQIETTVFRGTVEEMGSRAIKLRRRRCHRVRLEQSGPRQPDPGIQQFRQPEGELRDQHPGRHRSRSRHLGDRERGRIGRRRSGRPCPCGPAAELVNDAVTLSISYWYPATVSNSLGVTDGVIRATTSALSSAGIHLTVRSVTVTQASAEGSPSVVGAAGDTGSDGDEDSSSTS